jgi:SPP1 gp7 family putative phage head morphogenesis protein
MANISDKILDQITGHSVDLLRLDASLRKDVLKELKTLQKNLVEELEKQKLHLIKRTPFQMRRLEKMLKQTKTTIRSAYYKIDKLEDKQLAGLAKVAEAQAVSSINTALKVQTLSTGMSVEMLAAIATDTLIEGAPSKEWWGRQAGNLELKFKNTIRQGLLQGKTTDQIVQRVRGTRANKFKDGIMEATRRQAEALVRTSVQVVANEARMRTYEANNDLVKGVEWVSTLDSRTSTTCQALDGLMWDNNRRPIGHDIDFPGATAHWNCRSSQISVLKGWGELGVDKKHLSKLPQGTRASMDGQVSKGLNYEDWLRSKPESFQKEALGVGKWKLWKKGKVGFTDLLDQSGNPLSLEQLQDKFT